METLYASSHIFFCENVLTFYILLCAFLVREGVFYKRAEGCNGKMENLQSLKNRVHPSVTTITQVNRNESQSHSFFPLENTLNSYAKIKDEQN